MLPTHGRYPGVMGLHTINLSLDEKLVQRAREQDVGEGSKSDAQVVEDALAAFLGLRALDEACGQGTLLPEAADELAVAEVRAARRVDGRT
jgi:2-polyprenyl-3-methyl-5-hydroxy-6-metoxy-1,4-benzoquinol methylase